MNTIKLSYIITTRNKLPYIKNALTKLLEYFEKDEEIVVIDAGSTDGTKEYLSDLYEKGVIHQFVSEPDKGESHGWNKALLMAKGELIKLITDDDPYYYPGIKKCKEFMLEHKDVEVLGFDGFYSDMELSKINIRPVFTCKDYVKWMEDKTPFLFCGISIMIRRSAIPFIGLFHSGFVAVDYEYTLRITSINVKMAWYSGYCFVNIKNEKSNSSLQVEKIVAEREKVFYFYLNKPIVKANKLITRAKKLLRPLKEKLIKPKKNPEFKIYYYPDSIVEKTNLKSELNNKHYLFADYWLTQFNAINNGEFLFKEIPTNYLGKSLKLVIPPID